VAGGDAHSRVAVGDADLVADDADVGQEGDGETGAHGDAVDGRDDRLLGADDLQNQVPRVAHGLLKLGEVAQRLAVHLQIPAGRERLPGAGDHRDPDVGVGVDGGPDAAQRLVHRVVYRVVALWPVDRAQQDT